MYEGTEGQGSKGTKGRLVVDFYATLLKEPFKRFKLFERLELPVADDVNILSRKLNADR
jgi:hypothetical protein